MAKDSEDGGIVGLIIKIVFGVTVLAGVIMMLVTLGMTFTFSTIAVSTLQKVGQTIRDARDDATTNPAAQRETARRYDILKSSATSPSVAARSADELTLIAMTFDIRRAERDDDVRQAAKTGKTGPTAEDPMPLSIDFTGAQRHALITVSDLALALDVGSSKPSDGLLGLESDSVPDVSRLPRGVIGGFRTNARGNAHVVAPIDPGAAGDDDIQELCGQLHRWAAYYARPLSKVTMLVVSDPKRVRFQVGRWLTDGTQRNRLDGNDLITMCKPYPPKHR